MGKVTCVQTEYMKHAGTIDIENPRVSWNLQDIQHQTAFQIVAEDDHGNIYDSGVVESDKMYAEIPAFPSRSVVKYQVTVWDEKREKFQGEPVYYEVGLKAGMWRGKWINPEGAFDKNVRQPASYLRKNFTVNVLGDKCRLYMTAHGCYSVKINGKKVPGFIFAPGISQYDRRLQYQTYDVKDLLQLGENVIEVCIGDGYYRGEFGYFCVRNLFGSDLALLCQLEIDEKFVMGTDETWEASQDGALRENDMKWGEVYDARREDITKWHGVELKEFGYDTLVCSDCQPVAEEEKFEGKQIITPSGNVLYDFGQNIAGYVEFKVYAHEGQKITIYHGEARDSHGEFTLKNVQNDFNSIRQNVIYTCKEGLNIFKPEHCVFGFQYIKVETDVDLTDAVFTATAVYTDMEFLSDFQCGNEKVNQFFKNCRWSHKGNFLEIPTDCPTRERGGFTGDLEVYSHTSFYMANVYPILRKFLNELRIIQFEDGCIPQHAPLRGPREEWDGSAGWSDAICILPYRMYLKTGDTRLFEENYEAMRRWCLYSLNRAKESRDFRKKDPKPHLEYLLDTGYHWGEWLEPGWEYEDAVRLNETEGMPDVATSYMAFSLHITALAAGLLRKKEDQVFFEDAREKAKMAYREYCTEDGKIHSKRQCQYVRPIALDMLSEEEKQQACDDLAQMLIQADYEINTGFLTTHELLRTLCDYGHADIAYTLLLKEKGCSWLNQVEKGSTTVWESWDAIDEKGEPNLSLNHYALATVAGWLMDRAAGIIVENGKIQIHPYPDRRLGFAEGTYESPYGKIVSRWEYKGDEILYTVEIPGNTEAKLCLPGCEPKKVGCGVYHYTAKI